MEIKTSNEIYDKSVQMKTAGSNDDCERNEYTCSQGIRNPCRSITYLMK